MQNRARTISAVLILALALFCSNVLGANLQTESDPKEQIIQLLDKGYQLFEAGKKDEALADFQRASALSKQANYSMLEQPFSLLIQFASASDQTTQSSGQQFSQKNLKTTIILYMMQSNLGTLYFLLDKPEVALPFYLKSVELEKNLPELPNLKFLPPISPLGFVYLRLNQPDNAIAAFRKAVEIGVKREDLKSQAQNCVNLALAYGQKNDFGNAIQSANHAVELYDKTGDKTQEASALIELAMSYEGDNRLEDAVKSYQKSAAIYEVLHDKIHALQALSWGSQKLIYAGRSDEALPMLEKALAFSDFNPTNLHEAELQRDLFEYLSEAYHNLGNKTESEKWFKRAVEIADAENGMQETALGPHWSSTGRLWDIWKMFHNHKDYSRATFYGEKLLVTSRQHQDRSMEKSALKALVNSCSLIPNRAKTIQYANELLQMPESKQDVTAQISALKGLSQAYALVDWDNFLKNFSQLSVLLSKEGRYEELLQEISIFSSQYIAAEGSHTRFTPVSLYWFGQTYMAIGDDENAIKYFQALLDITKLIGNKQFQLKPLIALGNIALQKRDFATGIDYLKQALVIAKESKDQTTYIQTLSSIGFGYLQNKELESAKPYLEECYSLTESGTDPRAQLTSELRLGALDYELKKYDAIEKELLPKILSHLEQLQNPADYALKANAFAMKGAYEEKTGEKNLALSDYKTAISFAEKMRSTEQASNSKEEELQTFYSQAFSEYYKFASRTAATIFLDTKQPDLLKLIYSYSEEGKASALRMSLHTSAKFKTIPLESQIEQSIGEIQRKLIGGNLSADEIQQSQNELKQKQMQLQFSKNLRPFIFEAQGTNWHNLKEIQAKVIHPDTLVLDFQIVQPVTLYGDEDSVLLAISHNSVKPYIIQHTEKLKQIITDYLESLRKPMFSNELRQKHFVLGKKLFDLLAGAALRDFPGKTNLIIVPDGMLYYLPFETLLTDTKKPRYLVQDYAVSYTPSLSVLYDLESKTFSNEKSKKDWLAFGDPIYSNAKNEIASSTRGINYLKTRQQYLTPLKFTKSEILNVGKIFGLNLNSPDINLGERATEQRLFEMNLKNYKILHFATHGLLPEETTLINQPALAFSLINSSTGTGLLTTDKIYDLDIQADLVVLSACKTGLGKEINGEGVLSLNRAFLIAGAKSVVSSLWQVDDASTSIFMTKFYSYLKQGLNKTEALRKTKLELMKTSIYEDAIGQKVKLDSPFFWAPFILIGDRGKIDF